jgi:ankyrin repeat protein
MRKYSMIILLFLYATNVMAYKGKWDEDKKDWTPLMCVIYHGCSDCRDEFISQGVNINEITNSKMTALDIAIKLQDVESMNALLKTKQVINIDKYMISACSGHSVNVVQLLIQYGANPHNSSDNNYSPLMGAVSFGSIEIMKLLIECHVDLNQQRITDGITALMLATYNGDLDKVKLLLESGANKNQLDKNGKNASAYIDKITNVITNETEKELRRLLGNVSN